MDLFQKINVCPFSTDSKNRNDSATPINVLNKYRLPDKNEPIFLKRAKRHVGHSLSTSREQEVKVGAVHFCGVGVFREIERKNVR